MENLEGVAFVKFKTKEKAGCFVDWFYGYGEQIFGNHLDRIEEPECNGFDYNGLEITERD